jgi:phage FluMu protein Com
MIEVIEVGTLYEDRTFEIRCRRCQSLLGFQGADVTIGTQVSSITCPVCETGNDVKTAKDVTVEPAPA